MNVFLRELKAYRKSTIIWAASLSAIILMFGSLYPAFTKDIESTRKIFAQLPEALRTALNISLGNFFTINGFYGYLLGFVTLAAAIQAMNVGTGVISKEVSGKTADFLLSKPIRRTEVISAKLAAAFATIVMTDVVFVVVSYLMALAVSGEPFSAGVFFLLSLTLFLVQLIFFALGAFLSVVVPKIKSVVSVTLPTVFAFYIIGVIGDVLGNDQVRYISPFRFYESNYIINHAGLQGRYLVIEGAVVVVAIALSYLIFVKKDVRASV